MPSAAHSVHISQCVRLLVVASTLLSYNACHVWCVEFVATILVTLSAVLVTLFRLLLTTMDCVSLWSQGNAGMGVLGQGCWDG